MILSDNFISLIFTCLTATVNSQSGNTVPATTTSTKVGTMPCYLFGNIRGLCALENLPCDQLPPECTSIFWNGAEISLYYDVADMLGPSNDAYLRKILNCTDKPVFLEYGYGTFRQWSTVLPCCGFDGMNVQDEMQGLKAYLVEHQNIAGLIITNLDIRQGDPNFKDFSKNVKCYVEALKQNLPGMEIGIYLYADLFQTYYEKHVQEWIDFKELCGILNFVVMSYRYFNEDCIPAFKYTGLAPISGNFTYTMKKTQQYIIDAGIPKEKLILNIDVIPTLGANVDFSTCDVNPKTMCKNPKRAANWCASNIATLCAKGVFAKENAMGFAVSYANLDDAHSDCKCGRPYPGLHALLAGFKGESCPAPCHLYDSGLNIKQKRFTLKEKLILNIDVIPLLGPNIPFSTCDVNPKTMCKNPKRAANWCASNIATLCAKGVFAKENAMGFAVSFANLDDAHCDCQCGRPFPGLHALLAGFKGESCPAPCPLYDRC